MVPLSQQDNNNQLDICIHDQLFHLLDKELLFFLDIRNQLYKEDILQVSLTLNRLQHHIQHMMNRHQHLLGFHFQMYQVDIKFLNMSFVRSKFHSHTWYSSQYLRDNNRQQDSQFQQLLLEDNNTREGKGKVLLIQQDILDLSDIRLEHLDLLHNSIRQDMLNNLRLQQLLLYLNRFLQDRELDQVHSKDSNDQQDMHIGWYPQHLQQYTSIQPNMVDNLLSLLFQWHHYRFQSNKLSQQLILQDSRIL